MRRHVVHKYLLSLVLSILLIGLCLLIPTSLVLGDDFDGSIYDGYFYCWDAPEPGGYLAQQQLEDLECDTYGGRYLTDAIGGDQYNIYIGQSYWEVGNYDIYRGILPFDTSSLPDNANITSAKLRFTTAGFFIDTYDFNLTIVNANNLQVPALCSEFGELGNISGGSRNTSGMITGTTYEIDLNEVGLTWINSTSFTVLGLRSSREIAATVPTDYEYICIEPHEWNEINPGEEPMLIVTYLTPPTPTSMDHLLGVLPVAFLVIGLIAVVSLLSGSLSLVGIICAAIIIILTTVGTTIITSSLP